MVLAITVQAIRLELAEEEAKDAVNGIQAPDSTGASAFLVKGLELEEEQ